MLTLTPAPVCSTCANCCWRMVHALAALVDMALVPTHSQALLMVAATIATTHMVVPLFIVPYTLSAMTVSQRIP